MVWQRTLLNIYKKCLTCKAAWKVKKAPGWPSSTRISMLILVPKSPAQIPRSKYIVPMSLWLVEYSHRMEGIFVVLWGLFNIKASKIKV